MTSDDPRVYNATISVLVCFLQIVLATAGLFGHYVILYATYKTKEIQTKYGMLLVQLSITHIICIVGELLNTAFLIATPVLEDTVCFRIFALFASVMFWQSLVMLVISLDLLSAIVVPLLYRKWTTRPYVVANVLFCGLLSVAYTISVYSATRQENRDYCNLYTIQHDTVASVGRIANYVIAITQMLIYAACYLIIYIRATIFMRKNKNACYRNKHRKTMRTISVLIIVYTCTWVLSIVLMNILEFIKSELWTNWVRMIVSVLQMTCFAQTFYVCYQRSSEYRNIFRRIFKSWNVPERVKVHFVRPRQQEKPTIRSISCMVT